MDRFKMEHRMDGWGQDHVDPIIYGKGNWCKWEDVQALQKELKEAKASAEYWDNESHKEVSRLQGENERLRGKEKTTTNLLHKWHGDISTLKVAEISLIRKKQIMFEMEALLTKEKN